MRAAGGARTCGSTPTERPAMAEQRDQIKLTPGGDAPSFLARRAGDERGSQRHATAGRT